MLHVSPAGPATVESYRGDASGRGDEERPPGKLESAHAVLFSPDEQGTIPVFSGSSLLPSQPPIITPTSQPAGGNANPTRSPTPAPKVVFSLRAWAYISGESGARLWPF